MMPAAASQPILSLDRSIGSRKDLAKIRDNISAIVLTAGHLWLGGDEGTMIHRMTRNAAGDFGKHRRFDLAPLIQLPVQGANPPEIDIEGLDSDSGCLWLVSSHSLKRKKAKAGRPPKENRKRLATIESDGNRYTLARLPLDKNQEPAAAVKATSAARLEGDDRGSLLTEALAKDEHIAPFVSIPSKDNGLDIEGLAVRGNRAFVGLRGPVLRGWAIVIELELKDSKPGRLAFAAPPRKHFLELDGLGLRDLAIRGKDLYVLAGPTMDLDGPVVVYCWPGALKNAKEAVLPRKQLRRVLGVPFGEGEDAGTDHAEGITFLGPDPDATELLICYDSPAKSRIVADHRVRTDVFTLAGA